MIEASGLASDSAPSRRSARSPFAHADGEITGVLGPNGAGKSTTLRMIYGVLTPDGGSARIDGIDITRRDLRGTRPPRRSAACARASTAI